jgi:hypothetical protein
MKLRQAIGGLFRGSLGRYHPGYARSRAAYRQMRRSTPEFARTSFLPPSGPRGNVLLFSVGTFFVPVEAAYLKLLETLGYKPIVLANFDPWLRDAFALFGISDVRFVRDYERQIDTTRAQQTVDGWLNDGSQAWKEWGIGAVPCGVFAAASQMRRTREADIRLEDPEIRRQFRQELLASVIATEAAQVVFAQTRPEMLLICDRGYTPGGQVFYQALGQGCPVVTYLGAHKGGSAILKRYKSVAAARTHPYALSAAVWRQVLAMPWSEKHWHEVERELVQCYTTGEWFSEVGTQFNKQLYAREKLQRSLNLRPERKTAVIFPHMFWDATFCYGDDLFANYKEWFIELLKVAARNDRLNWVVKIHPANIVKARRDNYRGVHREIDAVHEAVGDLPAHVSVVTPESDISTLSLFPLMDYCLTVRGTVGMEAAAFGIPTLTAGTGRFDRLGFTHDFNSPAEYLACVARLEEIGPMQPAQIERARRYAHALLIQRPLPLDGVNLSFARDHTATPDVTMTCRSRGEFLQSKFAQRALAFLSSDSEDEIAG